MIFRSRALVLASVVMLGSLSLGLWGCATSRPQASSGDAPGSYVAARSDARSDAIEELLTEEALKSQIKELREELDSRQAAVPPGLSDASDTPEYEDAQIPLEVNERVREWIRYFSVKDHERFQRFLDRGAPYEKLVRTILRDHGVPEDIYYLAMIESGYTMSARSHAKAVGPWQFIAGTGKRYGLKISRDLDERRDLIRSTQAAARYLKGLYIVFQSWYLAAAAYNAGEGRILQAVIRGKTRDFWKLVEQKALPKETRNYVPKFLAAILIGKRKERYGFTTSNAPDHTRPVAFEAPRGLSLLTLARQTDTPIEELERLNPHLVRKAVPASLSSYPIWIPEGKLAAFESKAPVLQRLAKTPAKRAPSRRIASNKKPVKVHRVRPGENLTYIARKYGTTISKLKRLNSKRSTRLYSGERIRVPVRY